MTGYLYLASYPRSGNTLLRMILWHCFKLRTLSPYAEEEFRRLQNCPTWESLVGARTWSNSAEYKMQAAGLHNAQGICPLKMHEETPDKLDMDDPVIYVLRDGRETCVSYWRYHQDILKKRYARLRDIILGDVMFGGWSVHVKAWRPERRRNTLFLRYEDMRTKPGVTVGQIARFLGRVPTGRPPLAWGNVHRADPLFFRSGTNETWRELMTGDDLSLFWDVHGETMREYGYSEEACYANA